jgi:predicted secreted Zn-dependent protease
MSETEWFPRYSYETENDRLSAVAVTVVTRVTMPRWTGYAAADRSDQQEWDRFCRALRLHEQGHLDLVVLHLARVDERLLGRSVPAARRLWDGALTALADASRAYDRETDHGRKRGTLIGVTAGSFTER